MQSSPDLPGKRHSRQRDAVFRVLADAGSPLLPGEVLEAAGIDSPGIGQATVYRALGVLTECGVARAVSSTGNEVRYELATTGHHHHFRCRICGEVRCVDACPAGLPETRELPGGYRVEEHEVTFVGLCPECGDRPRRRT